MGGRGGTPTRYRRESTVLVHRAEADPHRPAVHLVSSDGWLNDPNSIGESATASTSSTNTTHTGPITTGSINPAEEDIGVPTKRTRDIAQAAATAPRPRAHLTSETGWLNDPHGVYYLDGRYHVFFQHVPDSLEWRSDVHWGHATSTDLLHWQWEPIALSPGDGDDGCWSGCSVIGDDGKPALFYTSAAGADHQVASIRIARPSGDGAWVKGVVVAKAPRRNIRLFRDPMVFRDGPDWRMLVGAGTTDGTAEVHTFISGDLETWEYDGVLASRNTGLQHPWTGTGWECPQLIRANGDGSDVLIVSIWDDHAPHDVAAATGIYADGRFKPHRWRLLTSGQSHFAASTFTDAEDRTSILFWVRGIADPGNWSGALSIPYVLTTDGDEIRLSPHPAVAGARTNPLGAPGAAIDVEWESAAGQRLALEDADGREHAVIEAGEGRITITVPGEHAPIDVAHSSPTLRIIADIRVLEVVADSGLVGLPLPATASGLVPRTDTANIRWWHLT